VSETYAKVQRLRDKLVELNVAPNVVADCNEYLRQNGGKVLRKRKEAHK